MTYSRRNKVEEQQEAALKAQHIVALCTQLHIPLDPIDWQTEGMQALVNARGVEISPLFDLAPRAADDLLSLVRIKLLERAALDAIHAPASTRASMWSPITTAQPQDFLSLWIITLDTDERIPIMESLRDGQRVYELYPFDPQDQKQLAALFGRPFAATYHPGDEVTIKEHARLYTGQVIYSIAADKELSGRRPSSRGYHAAASTISPDEVAARYIVDCHDGFPHIVNQFQIVPS